MKQKRDKGWRGERNITSFIHSNYDTAPAEIELALFFSDNMAVVFDGRIS